MNKGSVFPRKFQIVPRGLPFVAKIRPFIRLNLPFVALRFAVRIFLLKFVISVPLKWDELNN